MSRAEQSGGRVTETGEEGRHERVAPTRAGAPAGRTGAGVNRPTVRTRNAAPAGDCNREGGRGNTGVAAVHKAGEERRFGATPATATPLPSSWKARDPVRPSKARPLRAGQEEKRSEGQGSHREACVCRRPGAQISCFRGWAERPRVFADAEPSVEKPKDRQSERSDACRDRAKQRRLQPEGRACRREAVVRRGPEA